ncbi:exosortase-associated EpsI family protein [Sphingomonas sp. ZB1N12]|uniref:exosortase-associated EpsI family protein n=1 Tax=Sphingomonas arabinosi TaxID=3096160 RepID=UPI002FCA7013
MAGTVSRSARAPWTPYYPGADHYLFGRYADTSGAHVDMSIAVFGSQYEGKELIAYGTGVLREEDRWVRVAICQISQAVASCESRRPDP